MGKMGKRAERYRRWDIHTVHVSVLDLISSRTRDARTRDIYIFMVKWIGCRRLGNMICSIFYIYERNVFFFKRKISMHGIRPQGHSYAQVTLLSYDMFYVSMQLLFICTFLTMLLFMPYILSTLFVLTPLLRGLRFMPRRYTQMMRS